MATPALSLTQLASECEPEGLNSHNAEKIGRELAKAFAVKDDEVGIMRIDNQSLVFCYPRKLQNIGKIPLNSSTSVAVRTANTRRAEIINNFAHTKHTSLFETVELSDTDSDSRIIQKLMSAPVVGPSGAVGVIQVSRKGRSPRAAGPDFDPADLRKLVAIATALVKCFK